ncbi:hypothetical protein PVK06_031872 [Gossypium arboreum]|uniref:RNase H type-1 domain-containing protein n=1 Tax=Gossypium arboreum TaxID=29729 RepID=A0ABR0NSB3_GOSAR|nr:hypothetical protein PVK06_031872 [Gossypium arboreum]
MLSENNTNNNGFANGRRQSDGMEDALISQLRRLCSRDWLVTVKYASRTANKTADARARRVAPDTWTAQLFGVPPGDVLQSVEPDRAYGLDEEGMMGTEDPIVDAIIPTILGKRGFKDLFKGVRVVVEISIRTIIDLHESSNIVKVDEDRALVVVGKWKAAKKKVSDDV